MRFKICFLLAFLPFFANVTVAQSEMQFQKMDELIAAFLSNCSQQNSHENSNFLLGLSDLQDKNGVFYEQYKSSSYIQDIIQVTNASKEKNRLNLIEMSQLIQSRCFDIKKKMDYEIVSTDLVEFTIIPLKIGDVKIRLYNKKRSYFFNFQLIETLNGWKILEKVTVSST